MSNRRVVALDNDETLASWKQGSVLYSLWLELVGHAPSTKQFIEFYLKKGGARPGTRTLLQTLAKRLKEGSIDQVALYTGASNQGNWVTFVKDCLELYADTPGLFSKVICREPDSLCQKGRLLKDLRRLSSDPARVVLVDDKPQYAGGGMVIGVTEFQASVDMEQLVKQLRAEVKTEAKHRVDKYLAVLAPYLMSNSQLGEPVGAAAEGLVLMKSGGTAAVKEDNELQRVMPAIWDCVDKMPKVDQTCGFTSKRSCCDEAL